LALVESPYRWAVERRNREFETGRREVHRLSVPVVSVGNLTLGGTGKTPMVAWIAHWFASRAVKVALVSRGYKSTSGQPNDEARELEQKLPGVPHLQNRDRVAAARVAIDQFGAQVILLDDAFQHRRIARDFDIVLLDALEPFGFDHVFPRGTLREPLEGLARANMVVLTRADMVSDVERARIRGIAEKYAPASGWAECRHAPQGLVDANGKSAPLWSLRGQNVAAFCGIGNPEGFRHTLSECGCQVAAWREFPDHFSYDATAIAELDKWIAASNVESVVCTHKDLVKLSVEKLGGRPLCAVQVGIEFLAGQDKLEELLEKAISKKAEPRPAASPTAIEGWRTIEVSGKSCDIFEPKSPNPTGHAVIYLHGVHSNRLIDSHAFSAEFDRHGLRVIVPMTGRSWWADRICPEFDSKLTAERHVIENIVRWIGESWGIKPPGIALLGTSMGGQGALRLAFKHPNTFPVVAAISPAIDYQVRFKEGDEILQTMYRDAEDVRQDTATLHIHPLNWPRNIWFCCDPTDHRWHESAERLRSKLVALGIPHERDLETSGGGHGIEYYNRMAAKAIGFIIERLDQERRRAR
jgi:tetraacyldisaccharide 4'-kinase